MTPPVEPALLAASLGIVLAAGVVRGFAGFGCSALCVAGMSLLVSPARVVRWSRAASAQMEQGSPSVRLKQMEQ